MTVHLKNARRSKKAIPKVEGILCRAGPRKLDQCDRDILEVLDGNPDGLRITYADLAKKAGYARTTVRNHITKLEVMDKIKTTRDRHTWGPKGANHYEVIS